MRKKNITGKKLYECPSIEILKLEEEGLILSLSDNPINVHNKDKKKIGVDEWDDPKNINEEGVLGDELNGNDIPEYLRD